MEFINIHNGALFSDRRWPNDINFSCSRSVLWLCCNSFHVHNSNICKTPNANGLESIPIIFNSHYRIKHNWNVLSRSYGTRYFCNYKPYNRKYFVFNGSRNPIRKNYRNSIILGIWLFWRCFFARFIGRCRSRIYCDISPKLDGDTIVSGARAYNMWDGSCCWIRYWRSNIHDHDRTGTHGLL